MKIHQSNLEKSITKRRVAKANKRVMQIILNTYASKIICVTSGGTFDNNLFASLTIGPIKQT